MKTYIHTHTHTHTITKLSEKSITQSSQKKERTWMSTKWGMAKLWHTHTHVCMLSHFSHVRLLATLWTVAHQVPLSMGFSRPEHWSGLPHPLPGDRPNPGTEPASLKSPALVGRFFTISATWEAPHIHIMGYYLTLKSNGILIHATIWINLENVC